MNSQLAINTLKIASVHKYLQESVSIDTFSVFSYCWNEKPTVHSKALAEKEGLGIFKIFFASNARLFQLQKRPFLHGFANFI